MTYQTQGTVNVLDDLIGNVTNNLFSTEEEYNGYKTPTLDVVVTSTPKVVNVSTTPKEPTVPVTISGVSGVVNTQLSQPVKNYSWLWWFCLLLVPAYYYLIVKNRK
ncbi:MULTISPECIES: hypothetical protein [Chitinophagaceae]